MSDKRPLLLFSGGLDSTMMLNLALRETDVDVLSSDCGQHELKLQAEKLARQRIIRWMDVDRAVGDDERRFTVRDRTNFVGVNFAMAPGMVSSQAPAWLFAALHTFDPNRHSEVRIGYVLGDDALAYRHEMQEAWKYLSLLSKRETVPLVFPLISYRKSQFLKWLPADLLDLIWVCEIPYWQGTTIVQCGRCNPCQRHQMEMTRAFGNKAKFEKAVTAAKRDTKAYHAHRDKLRLERDVPEPGKASEEEFTDPSAKPAPGSDSSVEAASGPIIQPSGHLGKAVMKARGER
jgi:7-cyano-7-deazaguanine synthase in queuosine biosynthesis